MQALQMGPLGKKHTKQQLLPSQKCLRPDRKILLLLLLSLRTDSPRVLAFGFLKPSSFHLLLRARKTGGYLVSASLSALSQVCQHNSLWAHAEIGKGADLAGRLKKTTKQNTQLSFPPVIFCLD